MSRWRAPRPGSTRIITRGGFEALKTEIDDLWRIRRPEVVKALAAAAAEGDRSENAEYTYRKKQLAEMDRRIRYLGKRIPSLQVVDSVPAHRDAVFFGATVTLEDVATGETFHYRIVGPDETDARRGYISVDSPLARALLKKHIDDEVEMDLPGGHRGYAILGITYQTDDIRA